MGRRFGVSISHYGGVSWALAELERQLVREKVPILDIRGCAYPEMARAEQVRQARVAGVEVLVFIDSHVEASLEGVEELVAIAEQHGVALTTEENDAQGLEAAAFRRDVLEAMVRAEERRYENHAAVNQVWSGEKVSSVPLASPWKRDGRPIIDGCYSTDSQAFIHRAKATGAVLAKAEGLGIIAKRKRLRSRAANTLTAPSSEPGSQFALCIPSFGGLDIDQQVSVAQLEKAGMAVIELGDCPWIDIARSWLAEVALACGRGVFFLDHDIQFLPNDVLGLCEQALERDAVVAAAYCMRASGKNIIGSFDVPPGKIPFFDIGGTLPAYYAGLGFAAIPRSVLSDIALPRLLCPAIAETLGGGSFLRPWFALDCSTGFYAGEDVSFCNRVHDLRIGVMQKQAGHDAEWALSHSGRPARVFLDSRVRIFHRGSYDYGIEDAGVVVPRFAQLESTLTLSRAEARALMVEAQNLSVEAQLEARAKELVEP